MVNLAYPVLESFREMESLNSPEFVAAPVIVSVAFESVLDAATAVDVTKNPAVLVYDSRLD